LNYHIDRRIILNEDSEYKNLYKWSLQELDDEGAKIGRDLIPWYWSLDFTATEIILSDGITIEPDYSSDNDEPKNATKSRQYIHAKLRPGSPIEWHRFRHPTYSMFGTERTISNFELSIEILADGEEQDQCWVWGSVSYTTDIDFRDETTDDTIVFNLYVQPETFERYVKAVRAAEVNEAILCLRRVHGFYSDWSPSVSTDSIKVLTSHKEQVVEGEDESEIAPLRLGKVGEVSFTIQRKLTLEDAKPEYTDDDNWTEDDELAEGPSDKAMLAAQHSANANVRVVALLTSLRTAAWAIAALLILILVT